MRTSSKLTVMAALLFLALTSATHARTRPENKKVTNESSANHALIEPSDLVNAAVRVASSLDASMAAELWDNASEVAKRAVKRPEFVARMEASREARGSVVSRTWTMVRREASAGGQVPAGIYATVELDVRNAEGGTGRETVSFRLDDDGVWRFVGYVSG